MTIVVCRVVYGLDMGEADAANDENAAEENGRAQNHYACAVHIHTSIITTSPPCVDFCLASCCGLR